MRTIFLLPASVFILMASAPMAQTNESVSARPSRRSVGESLGPVLGRIRHWKSAVAAMLHSAAVASHFHSWHGT